MSKGVKCNPEKKNVAMAMKRAGDTKKRQMASAKMARKMFDGK